MEEAKHFKNNLEYAPIVLGEKHLFYWKWCTMGHNFHKNFHFYWNGCPVVQHSDQFIKKCYTPTLQRPVASGCFVAQEPS